MKTKQKFVDEVTGNEYDDEDKCKKYEDQNKEIKKRFSVFKEVKEKSCSFSNGGYCIDRGYEYYNKFVNTFIQCIKDFEPHIVKKFKEEKLELTPDYARGYYVGRCLDDGGSYLYSYNYRLNCFCHNIFKRICKAVYNRKEI